MATVYVAVHLIVKPEEPEQVLGVYEFEHEDWTIALQYAYDWLLKYRKSTCTYHVYC